MRKRDTLYTVNKYNKPLFLTEKKENIFDDGGDISVGANILAADQLASDQWGADYGEAGFTLKDYMSDTGNSWLGISKMDNPFSKMNIKGGLGSMLNTGIGQAGVGVIGGLASKGIYKGLSGGLNSGAGSTISNLGSTVGGALSQVNPLLGTAVQLGTGIIGGGVNALVGTKVDQAKLNAAREGTNAYNSFVSKAGSFDDIAGPVAQASVQNAYKGGLFKKSWARRRNRELKQQRIDARQWADRSISNNVNNLVGDQINDSLANYAAFGGPLDYGINGNNDMGAIEYGFMSDYLTQKKRQNDIKDRMSGISPVPAFMQNTFAIGGDMQTNGSDFSTGLTHIDAGGLHEENPNEGVQMGIAPDGKPNLVEEGEVVWNDYVFSNRIELDTEAKRVFHFSKRANLTYADAAKKLEKEIQERPNDPISRAGFNAQMDALEQQQERQKAEIEAERAEEAFDALSPEEKVAVMDNAAQEEAMAEQAAQEQAMAEQQAMQQPSPEEMAMMQQQQQMVSPEEAQLAQQQAMTMQQPMMAEGGRLYPDGGSLRDKILKLAGNSKTWGDFWKWARENKVNDILSPLFAQDTQELDWEEALKNEAFRSALAKDNAALRDALARGYDFGQHQPNNAAGVTFPTIAQGNWENQTYEGWKDSKDPAWLEAVETWKKAIGDDWANTVRGYNRDQIAEALRNTKAFQRGTQWLKDSDDNRLRYLTEIYNNFDTPKKAKEYASKFIEKDANGNIVWKADADRSYKTIFDNPSGRAANPGTYWHTPLEAVRDNQVRNMVINDNGTVEEIIGDVPTDWAPAGNYSWATPQSDITYNYYKRPIAAKTASETTEKPAEDTATAETSSIEPVRKWEGLRYAGLFGPAVGLGMQMAGVGKPDTSALEAAANIASGPAHLADYERISNYLTYRPMDIWFEQNRMDANARATDRAIMNTASSPGGKMAGLLASGYNSQIADGDLYRKALEYNDNKRAQVEAFNRGTDQFNAEAHNRNSQFNADALNRQRNVSAQMKMQAAAQKMDADASWYNGIYGNVAGLFKGLSDLGRENVETNWRNALVTAGAFGNMDEDQLIRAGIARRKSSSTSKSKGGKITRRKSRKGLTF